MKVLLRPPIDCVFCGSRRFYSSRPQTFVTRVVARFLHYYRCHDCGRYFMCVSRSRVHWHLRMLATFTFALVFLVVVGAVWWVILSFF